MEQTLDKALKFMSAKSQQHNVVITLDNQLGSLTMLTNNDMIPQPLAVITRPLMSSRSIAHMGAVSAASLADLLATLAAASLPQRKRQELASAIRTTARALGRPPQEIPADGRMLASRLRDVAPAAMGISTGRWNNIRSLLRKGLSFIEPISPGRNRNDLSPEWRELHNKLGSRSEKIA